MKFNFKISNLALKDLNEIWAYTAEHWSKQQANKYYREIIQAIQEISNSPELGKPIDDVIQTHRRINVKSHMVIYKIKDETLFVDRILHQMMDIDKHLKE